MGKKLVFFVILIDFSLLYFKNFLVNLNSKLISHIVFSSHNKLNGDIIINNAILTNILRMLYFDIFLTFFVFCKCNNSEEKTKNSYRLFSFIQILFFHIIYLNPFSTNVPLLNLRFSDVFRS